MQTEQNPQPHHHSGPTPVEQAILIDQTELYTPEQSASRLADYLEVVWSRKWSLFWFIVISTLLLALYTFTIPHTYIANAKLMPPGKEGGGGARDFISRLQSGGLDFSDFTGGGSGGGELFQAIITSRTMADSLIRDLDLIHQLDLPENRTLAIEIVQNSFTVEAKKTGVIDVSFGVQTSRFPTESEVAEARELSADIVNDAIRILDVLNREKIVTDARSSREYLERLVTVKKNELDSISQVMADFQTQNNALNIEKQVEASISAIAEVESQIMVKEIELETARQDFTSESPVVSTIQRELSSLRQQRSRLRGNDVLGLNIGDAPDLAKRYAQLKLALEVSTQVYTYLEAQYNSELFNEQRDLPTVSVLDPAVPPVFRSAPRRTFIVMIGFVVILVLAALYLFVSHLFSTDFRDFARANFPRPVLWILRVRPERR